MEKETKQVWAIGIIWIGCNLLALVLGGVIWLLLSNGAWLAGLIAYTAVKITSQNYRNKGL